MHDSAIFRRFYTGLVCVTIFLNNNLNLEALYPSINEKERKNLNLAIRIE